MSDIRYATALASIKAISDASVIDLHPDDYAFLTQDKLWISRDRSRARRCIEAATYGALDMVGLPRFAVPAEFVAAAIAYFVKPQNLQLACVIMEGVEWSENIISGVDKPLTASVIFAHSLRILSGKEFDVDQQVKLAKKRLKLGTLNEE